jgi:hypothetical protein
MASTISCPVPTNINPLSPNGFMFGIHKLPSISFFCQSVNLPGLTLGAPEFGNPFNVAPIPGETLTYDQLTVQFLVDESMANYQAIYNWIVALGFPESYDQYITFTGNDTNNYSELAKNYSDATLQILTGNNNVAKSVQFIDLFPIGIDSLQFAGTNNDVQYLIGNATFRYGFYKFL